MRKSFAEKETHWHGFVLTMDVAIAIGIAGIILAAANFERSDVFPDIEARKLAADIVAVMDYSGVLRTYDKNRIEGNLSAMLPANLNMSMAIKKYSPAAMVSQLQINADITENYLSGKWFTTSIDGDSQFFYLVEYRVKFK